MTQSDPSGQDGPARRGSGRSSSTETVDKSGATESATSTPSARSTSGDNGAATQGGSTAQGARTSASASGSTGSSSTASTSKGSSDAPRGAARQRTSGRSTVGATGAARTGSRDTAVRKPRRARLRLTQVDAWTVMKTSFLLSIALGIVSVVAVAIVWVVLGAAGVFDSMNDTVQTLLGNDFRVQDYIGTGRILGFTMILAVVDVVLLTAIATLAAFLYNLAATLLGGVEVTLTEDS